MANHVRISMNMQHAMPARYSRRSLLLMPLGESSSLSNVIIVIFLMLNCEGGAFTCREWGLLVTL